MKSLRLLLMWLALSPFFTRAQTIQNLQIIPANPTSADSVKVVADLAFTSGGCDLVGQQVSINGSLIDVTAKHCVGMLTVICYTTDTISLGTLPSGTYQLQFDLQTGTYDFSGNCTSFQSSPPQTLAFSVSPATGIADPKTLTPSLLYSTDKHRLLASNTTPGSRLRIIDLTGRTLFNGLLTSNEVPLQREPAPGLLIYTFTAPEGKMYSGRLWVR